jgi:hypothetical protein
MICPINLILIGRPIGQKPCPITTGALGKSDRAKRARSIFRSGHLIGQSGISGQSKQIMPATLAFDRRPLLRYAGARI